MKIRNNLRDQNVDSKIELFAVDQIWKLLILLYNRDAVSRYLLYLPCEKYAFALTQTARFDNHRHSTFFLFHEVHQIIWIRWKNPCFGKESEFMRELFLDYFQVLCQIIFQWNNRHPRKMVDFLIGFHPFNSVNVKVAIKPNDIPVGVLMLQSCRSCFFIGFVSRHSPPEHFFSYVFDQIIMYFPNVYYNLIWQYLFKFSFCLWLFSFASLFDFLLITFFNWFLLNTNTFAFIIIWKTFSWFWPIMKISCQHLLMILILIHGVCQIFSWNHHF